MWLEPRGVNSLLEQHLNLSSSFRLIFYSATRKWQLLPLSNLSLHLTCCYCSISMTFDACVWFLTLFTLWWTPHTTACSCWCWEILAEKQTIILTGCLHNSWSRLSWLNNVHPMLKNWIFILFRPSLEQFQRCKYFLHPLTLTQLPVFQSIWQPTLTPRYKIGIDLLQDRHRLSKKSHMAGTRLAFRWNLESCSSAPHMQPYTIRVIYNA